MDLGVTLVATAPFIMVVAIVFTAFYFSSKNRRAILEVVKAAAKSGQQLTPEAIKALGMPKKNKGGDLKSGAILIAVALALIVLGFSIGTVEQDQEAVAIMSAIAAFPGFIGVVLLGFGWMNREKNDK